MNIRRLTSLGEGLVQTVFMVLTVAIVASTLLAAFFWIMTFVGDRENPLASGTPFTVAQVMAIFAAFGLAGGFTKYGTPEFRYSLRLMATLYLMSALCFSLMGMLLPALASAEDNTTSSHVLLGFTVGAIAVATVTFSVGTFVWMSLIPELLRKE